MRRARSEGRGARSERILTPHSFSLQPSAFSLRPPHSHTPTLPHSTSGGSLARKALPPVASLVLNGALVAALIHLGQPVVLAHELRLAVDLVPARTASAHLEAPLPRPTVSPAGARSENRANEAPESADSAPRPPSGDPSGAPAPSTASGQVPRQALSARRQAGHHDSFDPAPPSGASIADGLAPVGGDSGLSADPGRGAAMGPESGPTGDGGVSLQPGDPEGAGPVGSSIGLAKLSGSSPGASTPLNHSNGDVSSSVRRPADPSAGPETSSDNRLPKGAPGGHGVSRSAGVTRQTQPAYPDDARADGVEGTATVLVSLDAAGKITSVRLVTSSGDRRLDRAAIDGVRDWTFASALEDGKPASGSLRVHVRFRLEGE